MKDRPRSQLNIHTDHRAAGAECVLSVFIWGVGDFINTNAVMEMELEKIQAKLTSGLEEDAETGPFPSPFKHPADLRLTAAASQEMQLTRTRTHRGGGEGGVSVCV